MREAGGYAHIIAAIEKLGKKHEEHMKVRGTASPDEYSRDCAYRLISLGVANRGASGLIPRTAEADDWILRGSPAASNMDFYVVTARVFQTTCIN